MRAELVTVTPEMASDLLSSNENNRRLAPPRVARLAAEIKAGRWQVNGETVILSRNRKLLDGQHRLAAVVASGIPVPMLIVYDADESASETIDTGRARSTGDILRIKGNNGGVMLAASATLLWRVFHRASQNTLVPANYVLSILERYPQVEAWQRRWNANGAIRRVISAASLVPGLVYLEVIAGRPDLAERLFSGLATGAGLNFGDPVLALRNRVMNMRGQGRRMDTATIWPAVARTISALEADEQLQRVQAVRDASQTDQPDRFREHLGRLSAQMRLDDLLPPQQQNVIRGSLRQNERPLGSVRRAVTTANAVLETATA
jgi:hypothetical protein